MFIINWIFDKLGYIPKIKVDVGIIEDAWPFPVEKPPIKKKPVIKKATTRKTTKKVK
jgi:hypothetical protein